MLSAFLLSQPFLVEVYGGHRVDRRTYLRRRVLRIVPLYAAAVVGGALLSAHTPADMLRAIPYLLFLNPLATPLLPYSGVWWSMATEVQFYVLLPLLPSLVSPGSGRWVGVAIIALWVSAYGAFLVGVLHAGTLVGETWLSISIFGRAPAFAIGVLAAWLYQRHGATLAERLRRLPPGVPDLALVVTLSALAFLLRWAV